MKKPNIIVYVVIAIVAIVLLCCMALALTPTAISTQEYILYPAMIEQLL